ncbi:MAG TPA: S8/S53 family peptidase [Kribbella sp.]|jgi:hypothetical protein
MSDQRPTNGGDQQNGRDRIRTREHAQIELILTEFGDEVEVWPPDWAEVGAASIYRTGSFLIRDRDLPRVREIFEGGSSDFPGIDGLTRFQPNAKFEFPPGTPEASTLTRRYIAFVDRLLGRGVARPDYVVYVCPSVSPCPATEPLEVSPGTPPLPGPVAGDCDGRGVKVLIVDVGWTDPNLYWLAGVTGEPEVAFVPGTTDIVPYAGHGTFIAGVLRCVAPRTEVVVKAYLTRAGAEFGSDLVVKLDEGLAENPDLISLSAGTTTGDGSSSLAFDVFLERLSHLKGVVLVAAAGNNGDREFFFPAASPGTVSVGALAEDLRRRASFSNHGGWVDVYAPGEDLVNAYLTGDYECTEPPHRGEHRHFAGMAKWSGTSFATPLVAGLIAGRMSVTGENARQAADALLAYAPSMPGVGRVLRPTDACPSTQPARCTSECDHHC